MIKNTLDLIKILPFDQQFKAELLGQYGQFDADQKYTIDGILWDTYDALYKLKLEENLQAGLLRAKDGQEILDEGFYKRIREQTDRQLQAQEAAVSTHVDLHETRKKIQELLAAQGNA
jgi:hypothetical protein